MPQSEIHVDENGSYSSTTNQAGIIITVSKDFENISGYSNEELENKNHNIVRHEDMPKVIFKIMWEQLADGKKFLGFFKNRSKHGEYFWMATKTYLLRTEADENRTYFSHKSFMSPRAKHHIGSLYEKLLEEEKKGGIEASEKYLKKYLKFRGVTFSEYMETFFGGGGLFKVGLFMARKVFSK